MTFDPQKLAVALIDPAVVPLPDADAAAAISAPVLTPKTGGITYKSAGASSSLGATKAITLRATLLATIASPAAPAQLVAACGYVHDLLSGPGFDASDPAVPTEAAMLIGAGIISQPDANTLLYDTSYKAGGIVTTGDVAAARAVLAIAATRTDLKSQWYAIYTRGLALIDMSPSLPTLESLRNI